MRIFHRRAMMTDTAVLVSLLRYDFRHLNTVLFPEKAGRSLCLGTCIAHKGQYRNSYNPFHKNPFMYRYPGTISLFSGLCHILSRSFEKGKMYVSVLPFLHEKRFVSKTA